MSKSRNSTFRQPLLAPIKRARNSVPEALEARAMRQRGRQSVRADVADTVRVKAEILWVVKSGLSRLLRRTSPSLINQITNILKLFEVHALRKGSRKHVCTIVTDVVAGKPVMQPRDMFGPVSESHWPILVAIGSCHARPTRHFEGLGTAAARSL